MPFRESSSLLDNSERSTEFQRFLLHFKKYYFFPLCIIVPLIIWISLMSRTGSPEFMLQASASNINCGPNNGIYKILPIVPLPDLLNNGSIKVERFNLVITKGKLFPDTTEQEVFLVNGQYPSPIIRIQQNSILIVTVTNYLNMSITIHLHGIHQRGTYLDDGVPKITQDPILPGGTYTHTVNTWPQAGTFFYHAHTGMDIIWISGPLIIEDNPSIYASWPREYQYDEDRVFLINGVYHDTLDNLINGLIRDPVYRYPRVDSVIINGKGHGLDPPPLFIPPGEVMENTTVVVKPIPPSRIALDITAVQPKMRYRFRFINSISDGTFRCKVPGHKFTVIEMDGIYTEPVKTDNFVISPGQRYSFIVVMNQTEDSNFVICKHLEIEGPTGLSVLKYGKGHVQTTTRLDKLNQVLNTTATEVVEDKPTELKWIFDNLTPNFDLHQIDVYHVPEKIDHDFLLDVNELQVEGHTQYLINEHLFQTPNVSYHEQLSQFINITDPPQVYEVLEGQVVQMIFQNQRLFSVCFGHPWHLHGHSFHVVGHGPDKFNPITDGEMIKENVRLKRKMQFRDTVTVNSDQSAPETEHPKYCGWTAIRFIANNPGVWLLHCHVTPHMLLGKRAVIWEHTIEDPFLVELANSRYSQ